MKFAKIVFSIAGIWGILLTVPLYFSYNSIGRHSPLPITHPEFYFGFVGVTFAWQLAFLLIAIDPSRYRFMMIPAIVEKLSYVLSTVGLLLGGRISPQQAAPAASDTILLVLFIVSYSRVKRYVLRHQIATAIAERGVLP